MTKSLEISFEWKYWNCPHELFQSYFFTAICFIKFNIITITLHTCIDKTDTNVDYKNFSSSANLYFFFLAPEPYSCKRLDYTEKMSSN